MADKHQTRWAIEAMHRAADQKSWLALYDAALASVSRPGDETRDHLLSILNLQAGKARQFQEYVTYYEASVARDREDAERAESAMADRRAQVLEPTPGARCQAEVSDHDSRWPRFHQCSNRAKGRADLKDWGPTDLCGTHVRRWTEGKAVWPPHKERG